MKATFDEWYATTGGSIVLAGIGGESKYRNE